MRCSRTVAGLLAVLAVIPVAVQPAAVEAMGLPARAADAGHRASATGAAQANRPPRARRAPGRIVESVAPSVISVHTLSSTWATTVDAGHAGTLEVMAVAGHNWPHHVTSVSGGGAGTWRPVAAPHHDRAVLQIWYTTVDSPGRSVLRVDWSGAPGAGYVAIAQYAATGAASWDLARSGWAVEPFPVLAADRSGVYVGAAVAAGNAQAGTTPGFTYTLATRAFVFATAANVIGTLRPDARGAAAVGAVLVPSAAAGAAGAPTGSAHGATATTAPPGGTDSAAPGPAGAPPAGLMPKSIFGQDVQGWPVDPRSAQFAADIVDDYKAAYGSVGVGGLPIYAAPAGAGESALSVRWACNGFLSSTGATLPAPPYVQLNGSSDNPLVVYQPSSGQDWELWSVRRTGASSYSACWGGRLDMATSDGVFPNGFGLSATGISYLATTITEADVASGSIDHAIGVILPRCNWSTYPADRGDCGSDPGQPAEGQWFRFPPGLAMPSGLAPFAQMVFRAVQRYGMVVIDQGGAVMIEAEQRTDWAAEGHVGIDPITASWGGQPEYGVVANLPWADLQTVVPPR